VWIAELLYLLVLQLLLGIFSAIVGNIFSYCWEYLQLLLVLLTPHEESLILSYLSEVSDILEKMGFQRFFMKYSKVSEIIPEVYPIHIPVVPFSSDNFEYFRIFRGIRTENHRSTIRF